MRGAVVGIGLWLGVADGGHALLRDRELAGPFVDRIGTMACSMGLALLATAIVAAVLARVVRGTNPPRPRATAMVALAAVVAALVIAAATGGTPPETPPDPRPNVLLVSVDTLRPDHLGAYGHREATSPRLDRLAHEGIVFEDAYSASSWTLPAHVSALTGLDPFAHGVVRDDDRLADEFVTLAEHLRGAGYRTAAWVGTSNHGFVGARHGLDQGFDLYRHAPHPTRFARGPLPRLVTLLLRNARGDLGAARHLTDSVIGWLRGQRREPFFHFVHYYDVHSRFDELPYEGAAPFGERFCAPELQRYDGCRGDLCASERLAAMTQGAEPPPEPAEIARMQCLYDGAIAFVDHEIGRLLDALDAEGLADRTVVIVTSDHGEAFFEHGMPLHVTLHDEVLRIPLIVRLPGGAAGKRAAGAVRLIDLVPTVLELVGVETREPIQGLSLVPVLLEWPVTSDAPVLAADHRSGSVALRRGTSKIIRNGSERPLLPLPPREHFDLAADPAEQWNRASVDPATSLFAELERLRAESERLRTRIAGDVTKTATPLSEREQERLRALGYLDPP